MYMKIADAQKKALRLVLSRKNPADRPWVLDTDQGDILIQRELGEGAWSTAYLASDEGPYPQIVFLENDVKGDASKSELAGMNLEGPRQHIPIIEYFGKMPFSDNIVFKMPLYNEFKLDSPEHIKLFEALKTAQKAGDRVMYTSDAQTYEQLASDMREAVLKHLGGQIGADSSIFQDLLYMHQYLSGKQGIFIFEFPKHNLATDGEGKVILLDVLYPITVLL